MTGMGGTLTAFEDAGSKEPIRLPVLPGLIMLSCDQNMERTLLIRRAFQEDKELGPHNLCIRYKDGLVTLWGPVERRALIDIARKKASLQKGVVEVRSELYLGRSGNRSVGPPSSGLPFEQPVRVQAASPNPETGALPSQSLREDHTKKVGLESGRGAPFLPPLLIASGGPPAGVQILEKDEVPPKAPVFVPLSFGGIGPMENPRKPISGPKIPALDISEELARLRGSQARFGSIQWIRRGNHLFIVVPGADLAAGSEFSNLARQIPGVDSVSVLMNTR